MLLCKVQETLECSEQLVWWCLIFETQQAEHAVEFCLSWFPDFCTEEFCNIPVRDTCLPLLLSMQSLGFDFFLTSFQSGKRFLLFDIQNRDGRSGESCCSLACRQTSLVIIHKRICPILVVFRVRLGWCFLVTPSGTRGAQFGTRIASRSTWLWVIPGLWKYLVWAWIWQIAAAALEYTGEMWIFTTGLMFWLGYVQPCCAQSLSLLSISSSPSHFNSSTSAPFSGTVQGLPAVSKPVKIIETPLQLLSEWKVSGGLAFGELGLGFSSHLMPCVLGWAFWSCDEAWAGVDVSPLALSSPLQSQSLCPQMSMASRAASASVGVGPWYRLLAVLLDGQLSLP